MLLNEAKTAYIDGNYSSSFIKSFIALETFLRTKILEYISKDKNLLKDSQRIEKQPINRLLKYAEELKIIPSQDLVRVKDLIITRNNVIHNGKFPTSNITKFALDYTNKIVNA